MGESLVNAGPPQKADMIVVLGGDWKGQRILKAAGLAREGYAPKVMVSGANGFWGHHESDLSIPFAVENGYLRDDFIPVTFPALATVDEAAHDIEQLRKMGVHKILLVTSPWHTARAVRIFHRTAPDLEVHAVSSDDRHWAGGYWWKGREGRKLWLMEEMKTAADLLGL
jgi:uncharacterized SAM-binding protein YcdF (DUF218 family)